MLIRPHPGERAYERGFSMIDMPDHADINTGLFQSFLSSGNFCTIISAAVIRNLWVRDDSLVIRECTHFSTQIRKIRLIARKIERNYLDRLFCPAIAIILPIRKNNRHYREK